MVPPTQRPALSPELHVRLLALPGGAGDLWIHLWLLADRAGEVKTTERELATAMARSVRWVSNAVAILKDAGLLAHDKGMWKIRSMERSFHTDVEETFHVVEETFHTDVEETFHNVEDSFHTNRNVRSTSRAPLPPAPPSPVTNERENVAPPCSPPTIARFEEFFRRYPAHRRTNRTGALTVWVQGDCDRMAEAIGGGLDRWLGSEDWADDDGKYVPSATKFLAEQRWLTEPRKPKPTPSPASRWVQRPDGRWVDRDNPAIFKPTL